MSDQRLPHETHPELYPQDFHTRHRDCTAGDRNTDCPTGLHTAVPLLGLGAMHRSKTR